MTGSSAATNELLSQYDITLYHQFPSRSTRAKWLLVELGIDKDVTTADINLMQGEQYRTQFKQSNPMGAIPVLQLQPKTPQLPQSVITITESCAIIQFLARGTQLEPPANNIAAMAKYTRVIALCAGSIDPLLWDIRRHEQLLPKNKRLQSVADMARSQFISTVIPTVEQLLTSDDGKDVEFVCESFWGEFTAADVMLGYTLFWAKLFDLNSNKMTKYMNRMLSRQAFQEVKEQGKPNMLMVPQMRPSLL